MESQSCKVPGEKSVVSKGGEVDNAFFRTNMSTVMKNIDVMFEF